jgi:hypothetical protein
MREKRKKIWIHGFQTKLSLRIAVYFALYQIAVWALVSMERHIITGMDTVFGGEAWRLIAFLQGIIIFLGILFIYDAIKFSHGFVGPVYRFRKTIQAINAGEEVDLVTLRKYDYLQEMKEELNEMLKILEQRGAIVLKENGAQKNNQQVVA